MLNWFQKAASDKIPDALFLALKLQQRVPSDCHMLHELLPQPFSLDRFFSREHLSLLLPCFQESTFCQPRVHSLWPALINILTPNVASQDDAMTYSTLSKKQKKARKGSSSEDVTKNICCFTEVAIEESLLMSSHDRKHLAFDILLLLLPRLSASCVHIILSYKLVQCLMDVLSTKGSWLHSAARHFLEGVTTWVGDDSNRLVAVVLSLQKHSNGRFDCITRTHTVKGLVAKFKSVPDCMKFVQSLMDLFVDEGGSRDELSDQSQTTDENSEKGSSEDSSLSTGNTDLLKSWVIDTLPRVLKNVKLGSEAKNNLSSEDMMEFLTEKLKLQTEIMKFLAVQGLFSASLGTEVTSFELQEKFKWPKTASSISLRRMCIEQLQFVMEDAQKGDGLNLVSDHEPTDLGTYFIRFLNTFCNIPSVSLFQTLSSDDETSFKKLQEVEMKLFHTERSVLSETDDKKIHAMGYLLIHLLLQILLQPGEFSDAASELVICCKKAFPGIFQGDALDEDEFNGENSDMPDIMDVLVDTLLSLLPQSNGCMCFAIDQVFRFFCNEVTASGLLRMLRVVTKDLKPRRHQGDDSDEDDDDGEDILGVEDAEDTSDIEGAETADTSIHMDETEEQSEGSEDNDDEMDDEAMFRMDSYITQFLKKSGKAGSDSATSQLNLFKLRVLSLLEIYLHRSPENPRVFTIFSHLARAYVNYHAAQGCKQLGERIWGILQKKIFKAKEYPRGKEIESSTLEMMLEKSLKSASRARVKSVSLLGKNSTFWILKIIHSRNFTDSELEGAMKIIQDIFVDYFNSKKCRLKTDFLKEILKRQPWIGYQLFGFLLEKCGSAKSEFRRIEGLDLVDVVIKSCVSAKKGEAEKDLSRKSKFLKRHLPQLRELLRQLLIKLPEKQTRRSSVRRFCAKIFEEISGYNLNDSFLESLNPDIGSACESFLGNLFTAFKNPNKVDQSR